jgi:hypothetical protein
VLDDIPHRPAGDAGPGLTVFEILDDFINRPFAETGLRIVGDASTTAASATLKKR